ncbi:unnamed protein product [Closterium sp. Naga37s-1]|nr:unnamed protein product [Closterium sp. Naga37s-1]
MAGEAILISGRAQSVLAVCRGAHAAASAAASAASSAAASASQTLEKSHLSRALEAQDAPHAAASAAASPPTSLEGRPPSRALEGRSRRDGVGEQMRRGGGGGGIKKNGKGEKCSAEQGVTNPDEQMAGEKEAQLLKHTQEQKGEPSPHLPLPRE